MKPAALSLSALVALAHLWFLVLEAVLWKTPFGRRVFRMTAEQAEATSTLAANQGLYNGFLAAGIVWGIVLGLPEGRAVLTFFLACVVVAGLFGAATVSRRILLLQALPASLALVCVRLA